MNKLDKILSNQLRKAFISDLYTGSRTPLDNFKIRAQSMQERALDRYTNIIHESEMMTSRNTCPSLERERRNLFLENDGSPAELLKKVKELEHKHIEHLKKRAITAKENMTKIDRIQQARYLVDNLETDKESFSPINNLVNISAKSIGASIGIGIASLIMTSFAPPLTQIFTVAAVFLPPQLILQAYKNNHDYQNKISKGLNLVESSFPSREKISNRAKAMALTLLKK